MGKKSRATLQRVAARAALRNGASLTTPQPIISVIALSTTAELVPIPEASADPPAKPNDQSSLLAAELDLDAAITELLGADEPSTPPVSSESAAQVSSLPRQMTQRVDQADEATTSTDEAALASDEPFELLSALLLGEQRQQVAHMRQQLGQLQRMLDELEVQINDEEALISTITPVIASAIRTNITESRDEMIDALYPIMGKLVQRSVAEAMRDLARRIDEQMRRTFDFKSLWRQLAARMRGISDAEMALRDAFPFHVLQIFLIHRETGLLLLHCAQHDEESTDSDIISSMLTAIRDFTEDAFGRGQEAELNEIQYGDRSILIEVAHLVYIAIVSQGVIRSGYREQMREIMIEIEHQHATALQAYDGDASRFDEAAALLRQLMSSD